MRADSDTGEVMSELVRALIELAIADLPVITGHCDPIGESIGRVLE
jgi:hypothetical protein